MGPMMLVEIENTGRWIALTSAWIDGLKGTLLVWLKYAWRAGIMVKERNLPKYKSINDTVTILDIAMMAIPLLVV